VKRVSAVLGLLLIGVASGPVQAVESIKIPAKLIFPEVLDFRALDWMEGEIPIEVEFTWPLESPVRFSLWVMDDRIKAGWDLEVIVKDSAGRRLKEFYPLGEPSVPQGYLDVFQGQHLRLALWSFRDSPIFEKGGDNWYTVQVIFKVTDAKNEAVTIETDERRFRVASANGAAGSAGKRIKVLTKSGDIVVVDFSKISVPLNQRYAWIADRKRRNPVKFQREYGWILSSKNLGANEVEQIAYLFFYSAGFMEGYLDPPVKDGDIWRCDLRVGFPASEVKAILVDARSGEVWQDGQNERVDALALIRGN
jgi:hypothetical protein